MPTVVVNGVTMEAKVGERLIDVARRNGAHVGFICNGAGFCQTCQCQVLSGIENLSPVNPFEEAWFSESQLNAGQRLACKSALRGDGPIEIRTKAEDLRRQDGHLLPGAPAGGALVATHDVPGVVAIPPGL